MKSLFLTFFALLFAFPVMADLATAGEVDLRIELLNGEEFEGYTFFVEYQTYYYEYGYQEGPIREVELEPGKDINASGRGGRSKIYARNEDGDLFESEEAVGGVVNNASDDVLAYVDQYNVVSMKDGKLKLEHKARIMHLHNGEKIEVSKSGIDFSLAGIIMSLACLVALVLFFIFRKKSPAKA